MGIGRWAFRSNVAQALSESSDAIIELLHAKAPPSESSQLMLDYAAYSNAKLLMDNEFALEIRRLGKRSGSSSAASAFASALTSVEGALPTLRLVYLGFLGNARFNGLLGRYPGSFEFATSALGYRTPMEQWIAFWHDDAASSMYQYMTPLEEVLGFGPDGGDRGDRLSGLGSSILAAAVDTVVGSGGQAVAAALQRRKPGFTELLGSTVGFREVMDQIEPAGSGFARLVEAETRLATDSRDE